MSTETTQPLSEFAEINPRTDLNGMRGDTIVSFIPMSDVSESGRWVERRERRLEEVRVGYTPFVEKDVLFAKITPCMENGKGAHATSLKNGVGFGSTEFHVLRARGDNDSRFLFHWLQARVTRTKAVAYMGGPAGQQRVQADFFSCFRIPRIDPREQSRIATVLDTVDEAIAKTVAVIAKLKQVRAGLLHDLLTCGLDEHGRLRDPVAHPEQFQDSPLGRIPKDWKVQHLNNVVRIIDCKHFTPKFVREGKAFIRPRNVKPEGLDFSDVDYISDEDFALLTDKHIPRVGDLVFSRNATFGVASYVEHPVPFAIGQDTVIMTEKTANTCFVYFVLRSSLVESQIQRVSTGSTFGRINLAFIRSLSVPDPYRPEQDAVAERMLAFDAQMKAEENHLSKLRLLKSGLMNDLLTGRVRVPEEIAVTG